MTFSHACKGKSTVAADYSAYIISAVVKDIDSLGNKRIGFRTDQEPSMAALQSRVKRGREEETVLLNSKVKDSQGNGVVEQAVQDFEGQLRTLKIALELRIGERIAPGSAVILWMVDYAFEVLNRWRVDKDGKTPRMKWNNALRTEPAVAEFGEHIYYMPINADLKQNKMDVRWEAGTCCGLNPGVMKCVWARPVA